MRSDEVADRAHGWNDERDSGRVGLRQRDAAVKRFEEEWLRAKSLRRFEQE